MGLFSDLNLSVTTKFGTIGLSGGKPSVTMNTAQAQIPEPAMPKVAPASAVVPWYKRPLVLAGIGGGVLLLVLLRR